jgi:NADP-reducing hydrogenase subunit HndD
MFGAVMKTYFPEVVNVPVEKIYSVSVMPCTAKKSECIRPQLQSNPGIPDVDAVITTRELARMIKSAGIDFAKLPEEDFDSPLGESSGAGAIFGATGGVMEAAIRTVYNLVTGKEIPGVAFTPVRGMEGIKEASVEVPINGKKTTVKLAVAHTLKNARTLMDKVRAGTADYHFIEIMACPGGCIGGGGQPQPVNAEIRAARTAAIYSIDEASTVRQSHNNPQIQALYKNYFGKPLSEKSHKYLHTHYSAQPRDL